MGKRKRKRTKKAPKTKRVNKELVLKRDGYRCRCCGREGVSSDPLTIHHVRSRSKFPQLSNDVDNMMTLLDSCHREHHFRYGLTLGRFRWSVIVAIPF